jgi:hypothetical protein
MMGQSCRNIIPQKYEAKQMYDVTAYKIPGIQGCPRRF